MVYKRIITIEWYNVFGRKTQKEDETMQISLDAGAFKPTRAHKYDAGLDLRSPIDVLIKAHGHAVVNTGVHVDLPNGTAGMLMSKSGLNVKHNLTTTGLIDAGYTGAIAVKIYNHGDQDYQIECGDKITQLVIVPVWLVDIEIVDELDSSSDGRGDNGFGSTGRK